MEKSNRPLTKTCSSCGLKKPISAFLQLAGAQSATYGNICASCRKANLDKPTHKETDEGTVRDADHRIGAEEKLHGDLGKKLEHQRIEDLYVKEQEKDEKQQLQQTQKDESMAADAKMHRKNYLEKRSFLNTTAKTADSTRTTSTRQQIERQARIAHGLDHASKQEQAAREEQKQTEIDLSSPFEDTLISGKEKFKGDAIKRFAALIGANSPFARTLAQQTQKTEKKEKTQQQAAPTEKDVIDYVKKTWGPKR
jgi:hypothetical protein